MEGGREVGRARRGNAGALLREGLRREGGPGREVDRQAGRRSGGAGPARPGPARLTRGEVRAGESPRLREGGARREEG